MTPKLKKIDFSEKALILIDSLFGGLMGLLVALLLSFLICYFYTTFSFIKNYFWPPRPFVSSFNSALVILPCLVFLLNAWFFVLGLIIGFVYSRKKIYRFDLKKASGYFKVLSASQNYEVSEIKKAILELIKLKVFHPEFLKENLYKMLQKDQRKELKKMVKEIIQEKLK